MKNSILFLLVICTFIITSCSNSIVPRIFIDEELKKPNNEFLSRSLIKIDPFIDHRNVDKNKYLKHGTKIYKDFEDKYCVNSEKFYRKDLMNLMAKLTGLYIKHQTSLRNFTTISDKYDYRLQVTIEDYSNRQDFSEDARKAKVGKAVAGGFGLIGSLAYRTFSTESEFESLARIKIKLTNIKLLDSDDKLLFNLEDRYIEVNENLYADADCLCAYINVDYKFKELMDQLTNELESKLIEYKSSF